MAKMENSLEYESSKQAPCRRVAYAVLLMIAVVLVTAGAVYALRLDVDHFDPMDYLMNSRLMWTGGGGHLNFEMTGNRPVLVTLLHAPLQAFRGNIELHWRAVHLVNYILSVGCLVALGILLKERFSRLAAVIMPLLFATTPVFLKYFALCYSDIVSMFMICLFLRAWKVLERESPIWDHVVVGLFMGGCMISKYPLLVLPGIFVAVESLHAGLRDPAGVVSGGLSRLGEMFSVKFLWLILSALGVFHVAHALVYCMAWPENSFAYNNIHVYAAVWRSFTGITSAAWQTNTASNDLGGIPLSTEDVFHEYFLQLPAMFSYGACALAVIGLTRSAMRRNRYDLVVIGSSLTFFAVMQFVIEHKEARYLFPVFPMFVSSVCEGWIGGRDWIRRRWRLQALQSKWVWLGAGLLFLVAPAINSARMLKAILDPIFVEPALVPMAQSLNAEHSEADLFLWESWTRDSRKSPRHDNLIRPSYLQIGYPRDDFSFPHEAKKPWFAVCARDIEYLLDRNVKLLESVDNGQSGASRVETDRTVILGVSTEMRRSMDKVRWLLKAFDRKGVLFSPGDARDWYLSPNLMTNYPAKPLIVTKVSRLSLFPEQTSVVSVEYLGPEQNVSFRRSKEGNWVAETVRLAPTLRAFAYFGDWDYVEISRETSIERLPLSIELVSYREFSTDFTKLWEN